MDKRLSNKQIKVFQYFYLILFYFNIVAYHL